MWWYRYTLKGRRTNNGGRKWHPGYAVSIDRMAEALPKMLAFREAPSGMKIKSWRWLPRSKRFVLISIDDETHELRWKEDQ